MGSSTPPPRNLPINNAMALTDEKVDVDALAKSVAESLKGLKLSTAKRILQLAGNYIENGALVG